MIERLRHWLRGSIRARLIAMTSAIVVTVVFCLSLVMGAAAAHLLQQASNRQLSQGVAQGAALLSNYLDVVEANFSGWANSPLVEAMFNDPALASVFLPSLRSYFAKAKAQEPLVTQIFLLQGHQVIYDDAQQFDFAFGGPVGAAVLEQLQALPVGQVAVLRLGHPQAGLGPPLVMFKQAFTKDGSPVRDAYVVLGLDFAQLQQKLFGQVEIGRHGFVVLVADNGDGQMHLPLRELGSEEEVQHLQESSQHWRSLADVPEQHRSILMRHQALPRTPLAVVGVASRNDILEPVLGLVYFSAGVGLLALVGGVWVAIYLSGRLTAPIQALTTQAQRMALEYQPPTPSADLPHAQQALTLPPDELGSLAHSFAQMQAAIRDKMHLVETQNGQLRDNERLMQELNQSLEGKVQERTQALARSLQELQTAQAQLVQSEKLASLGQLVANVAHEINTPIGAVKSSGASIAEALDAMLADLPSLFRLLQPPEQALFARLISHVRSGHEPLGSRETRALVRQTTQALEAVGVAQPQPKAELLVRLRAHAAWADYQVLLRHPHSAFILQVAASVAAVIHSADNINTAVERVAKIVFALKSFSRVGNDAAPREAQVADGVDTVLTLYQNALRRGVELVRDYQPVPPLICWADELNQVWTNLIHNALQAMDHKGVLRVGVRMEADHVVVSVADSGCGIPETVRPRIFEPFFTTKPTGEGSGLGLDIVQRIVDKHRGRIEVDSTVGVGSCFRVYLPVEGGVA